MDIVLINPQIPQNTGSIARTCAATQTPLHLVGQLGFDISEKAVRRAGLDYWPWVPLKRHDSWESYQSSEAPRNVWALTKFASRPYWNAQFSPEDAIVFGSEITGLGEQFIGQIPEQNRLLIPMVCPNVRSLNLSNAVSIVLYEALRQFSLSCSLESSK